MNSHRSRRAAFFAATGVLLAAVGAGDELVQVGRGDGTVDVDLVLGQAPGCAQLLGVDLQPTAEVQGLEGHEGAEQILVADDHAVVLHHDRVVALFKLGGDVLAQLLAAGHLILGVGHLATDLAGVGDQRDVRDLAGQAEGHQRRRMGMQYALQIRAAAVNFAVEGQLDGGLVGPDDGAVGLDLTHVGPGEVALVDAGRRDPDVAVVVPDGQVAAGGSGHAVIVDAVHDHDQLVGGMQKLEAHGGTSFIESWNWEWEMRH